MRHSQVHSTLSKGFTVLRKKKSNQERTNMKGIFPPIRNINKLPVDHSRVIMGSLSTQTDSAIMLNIQGKNIWIPKSKANFGIDKDKYVADIPNWILESNGITPIGVTM